MTIAVVTEKTSGARQDGVTSVVTATWTVAAGSVLLAFVLYEDDGNTITVADTVNGTYGAAIETILATGVNGLKCFAFTNSAAGSNAVTATFSANQNTAAIWVIELSGAKTASAIDTHNHADQSAPGTGANAITVSATNTAQPAMVVGLSSAITGSGDIAPNSGTGYTAGIKAFGVSGTDAQGRSEWKRVTNTASQAATFTVTAGNDLLRYLSIVVNVLEATSSLVHFAPEPVLRGPEGPRRMPFQTEALPPLVKRGAGFEALIVRTQPAPPLKPNQPDAVPPIFKKIAAFDPVIVATRPAPRRVPTEERGLPKPPPVPSMRLDDVEIEQTWPVPKRPPGFTEAMPPILFHLGGVDPLIVRTLAPARRVAVETHVPPPIVLDIGAFDPVIVPTRPARRLVSSQPEAPPALAASANPILGLTGLQFYVDTKVAAPTHSGSDVTAWSDLSTHGNDLNVVSVNKPQLLANGGVQFVAANSNALYRQNTSIIGTGHYCVALLIKVDAVTDLEVFFGNADVNTGGVNLKVNTASWNLEHYAVGGNSDGVIDTSAYYILIWDRATGAAPIFYKNNVPITLGASTSTDPIAAGANGDLIMGAFGGGTSANAAFSSCTILAAFICSSDIGSTNATAVYNYWFSQYLASPVIVEPTSTLLYPQTVRRSNQADALPPIFQFLGGIDPTIAATLPPAKRAPSQADATPPIFQAIAAFDPVIVATWPAPRRLPVEASGTPPIDSPRGGFEHLIAATLLPARRTPQSAETPPPIVLDIAGFDPLIVKTLAAARMVPVHFEATPPIDVPSGGFDSVIVATLPAARRTSSVLDATPPIVQHIAGFDPLIVPTRPAPLRAPVLAEGVPPILISVGGFDPSLAPNPFAVRRTLITDALSGVPTPWLSDLAQPVPRPAIYRAPSSPDGVPPVLTHLGGVDPVIVQTLPAPKRVPVQADATPPILISVGGFDLFVRLARPATIPSSSAESPPGARAVAGIDGASSSRPAGARMPAQAAEAAPPIVLHIAAFDPVIVASLPAPRRLSNQADAVPPIVRSVGGWDTYRAPLLSPARRSDTSEAFAPVPAPWLSDVASPSPRVALYRRPNQADATPPILIFLGGVDPVAVSTLRPPRRTPQEADALPAIFRQIGGFDPVRASTAVATPRRSAATDAMPSSTVIVLTAWADAVSPRQAPALARRPDLTDPLPSPIAAAITPCGYEPSTWIPSRGRSQPSQATDALPPFVVTLVLDDATRTRLPLVERRSAATEAFPGALHAWAPDSPGNLPRAGDRRRSAANDALPAATRPWAPDVALATPRPAWTSPRAREALVAQPMPMLVLGHWAPDPNVAGQPAGQRARVSFATDAFPFLAEPLAPVGGFELPTFPWRPPTAHRPTTLDVFTIRAVLKAFLQLDDIAAADLELLDAAVAELLASDVAVPNDGPLDLPVGTVEVTDRSVAEDEALDE